MRASYAYTLVELLLTLAIGGVLLSIALPQMRGIVALNHRVAALNNLLASLQYARSEAHKLATEVVVCPSLDLQQCQTEDHAWEYGWLVFADHSPSRPRQFDEGDELLRLAHPQRNVTIRANRPAFVLRPFQRRASNGTFVFCAAHPATPPMALIVSVTGRPRRSDRMADGSTIDCPVAP